MMLGLVATFVFTPMGTERVCANQVLGKNDDLLLGDNFQNDIEENLYAYRIKNSENEILISMEGDVSDKQIKNAIDGIASEYRIISGKFEIDKNLPSEKKNRLKKYLKSGNYKTIISLDVREDLNVSTAKNRLEKKSGICSVTYNESCISPKSYGVDDSFSSNQYYLGNINAKTAWTTFSKSGYKESYVAVIDTGLYTSNKDFDGMFLKNYSISIRDKVNGAYEKITDLKKSKQDEMGHGTHIAGIIAAKGNNKFSTVGVASGWINDCCKIMALKTDYRAKDKDGVWQSYFSDENIIEAINYAIAHGADVINMSLGGYSSSTTGNPALQSAINNAYNAGVTVVAAKGNDNKDTTKSGNYFFPADYKNVISVSATNSNNKKASFSNYGNVDIAAPGVGIYSSATSTDNTYANYSGTSMATPIVSATVALIKSINYDLTNKQVEDVLLSTTKNIGDSTYFGKGLVDTGYAVQKAKYLGLKEQTLNLKSVSMTSSGNAKIKWSDLYYAEGYCIYRSNSKDGKFTKIKNLTDDYDYYIDKDVEKNKTYYYKVRGYMMYDHGPGTVSGKPAGHSKYSVVKSVKITK